MLSMEKWVETHITRYILSPTLGKSTDACLPLLPLLPHRTSNSLTKQKDSDARKNAQIPGNEVYLPVRWLGRQRAAWPSSGRADRQPGFLRSRHYWLARWTMVSLITSSAWEIGITRYISYRLHLWYDSFGLLNRIVPLNRISPLSHRGFWAASCQLSYVNSKHWK